MKNFKHVDQPSTLVSASPPSGFYLYIGYSAWGGVGLIFAYVKWISPDMSKYVLKQKIILAELFKAIAQNRSN